jgi:hypothetical protein
MMIHPSDRPENDEQKAFWARAKPYRILPGAAMPNPGAPSWLLTPFR